MGSPNDEPRRQSRELQHEVEISKDFYIGVFEVTQVQYQVVMKTNPSYFKKGAKGERFLKGQDPRKLPVENVSWEDAVEFCKRLNELEKGAPFTYRLPTEAEWEYVCRAGTTTAVFSGNEFTAENFATHTQIGYPPNLQIEKQPMLESPKIVGSFVANPWGIYDMNGNVWEWVSDWYDPEYYKSSPKVDPQGPVLASDASKEEQDKFNEEFVKRSIRGGAWNEFPATCRAANRNHAFPNEKRSNIGFRVVLVPNEN